MTDLPKALREALAREWRLSEFSLVQAFPSQDGSVKYLFTLLDGKKTEAVYMPYENRKTVCLSTMVGCPAGCTFCATGALGFGRNLTAAEILDQLLTIAYHQGLSPREIRNVVLMGMGEPLLNLRNVLKAVRIMLHKKALALSPRRVTLSTVGIPKGIYRLAEEDLGVRLALSSTPRTTRPAGKSSPPPTATPSPRSWRPCATTTPRPSGGSPLSTPSSKG